MGRRLTVRSQVRLPAERPEQIYSEDAGGVSVERPSCSETPEISLKGFPLVAIPAPCLKKRGRVAWPRDVQQLWRETHQALAPGSATAFASCGVSGLLQSLSFDNYLLNTYCILATSDIPLSWT